TFAARLLGRLGSRRSVRVGAVLACTVLRACPCARMLRRRCGCRCVFGPDRCARRRAGRGRFLAATTSSTAPTSAAAAAALATGTFVRAGLRARLRALRLPWLSLLLLSLLLRALSLAAASLGLAAMSFGLMIARFALRALLSIATALLGGALAFVARSLTF